MSEASTSGSGREGRGGRGGDIIDLDLYMRQARPPSRHDGRWVVEDSSEDERNDPSSDSDAVPRPHPMPHPMPRLPRPRAPRPAPDKRHSHDSGLSDGSYRQQRRKHLVRRRVPSTTASRTVAHKLPRDPGPNPSPNWGPRPGPGELGQLRAKGDRISRVRRFSDQLRADVEERDTSRYKLFSKQLSADSDTSDLSSSCGGSAGSRPPDEFKTYKLIMTKLDELKQMFSARSPPAAPAPPPQRTRRPPPPSSPSPPSSSSSTSPTAAVVSRASVRHVASTVRSGASRPAVASSAMRMRELRTTPQPRPDTDRQQRPRDETSHKRPSTVPRVASPGPAAGAVKGAVGAVASSSSRCQSLCRRCRDLWRAITGRADTLAPHHA